MSKKKFTQDIADILADDLATLESIEPGAILRPELMRNRPKPDPAAASAAGKEPEVRASRAEPELAEAAPEVEAVVAPAIAAATSGEPASEQQTPLPLVDPSDVDQPDLFAAPTETPAAAMTGPGSVSRNPTVRQPSGRGGSGSNSNPDRGDDGGQQFTDAVTLLEISPPEDGGIEERALPGDRSLSPPSPPKTRRAWNHPVARWTFYVLMVVALTAIFLFLLIAIFHLG